MGARNRVGTGLSYWPARLHRLAGRYNNLVPTRFLAPIDCSKIAAQVHTVYTVCNRGRGSGCVESIYKRDTLCN
jgi:hypothetical protein